MKAVFILFAMLVTGSALAQNGSTGLPSFLHKKQASPIIKSILPRDTIIVPPRTLPNNPEPMPNPFKMKLPPDLYVGNNGKGQDIYRSQLDNMAILKPDSSFSGNMPNAIKPASPIITKSQTIGRGPNSSGQR